MVGAIVLNGEKYLGNIIGDYVIATDGGYDKCEGRCDILVGDMDSVRSKVTGECTVLKRDKDFTDGEYAVRLMIEKGVDSVNIYGLNGGRLDHILFNIALMAQLDKAGIQATCYCNDFVGYMVGGEKNINICPGQTISLVPFSDVVHIMYLYGVKWILEDRDIYKHLSLTISNEAVEDIVRLKVSSGQTLVIVNN